MTGSSPKTAGSQSVKRRDEENIDAVDDRLDKKMNGNNIDKDGGMGNGRERAGTSDK